MSDMGVPVPAPLKRFIWDIQSMVELAESEREILLIGRDLMARLVASNDWLPAIFALPDERHGRPYLLYGDGLERFCVVGTVLEGSQAMLVCQHGVWEILGLLRGAMSRQRFLWEHDGAPRPNGDARLVEPGSVDVVSQMNGEAIQLSNVVAETVSIGIHVYGGNLGGITRYALGADGKARDLLSGYANSDDSPAYDIRSIQTEIRD
jgi:predicted metal-dependent enzyme (double-stranded beta helix superfamily)